MKISRKWLQKYFEKELPSAAELSDALTFHAFEIEGVEKVGGDDILDVKVTANRGHDCLSHRGIAKELSAILNLPLSSDPLKDTPDLSQKTASVSVSIENSELCPRYIAGYVRGVNVRPSPKWLRKRLEAIGQRSINNVVDATNFVMFNTGQPLHAFNADKLKQKGGTWNIEVRGAKKKEKMTALDGKEYTLADSMLVIADANAAIPIGIAGIKGGVPAAISEATTDIIIESANFNGASVRKTAGALKLRTDASSRFEQVISPELAAYGIRSAVDMILKLAGGELEGFADVYLKPQQQKIVSVSLQQINETLGVKFSESKVTDVFTRLGFSFKHTGGIFNIISPFERLDLTIREDLIEEVGRIIGYDAVPSAELPPFSKKPEINKNFYAAEHVREEFVKQGFSEAYTSVFAERGERVVANKVDGVRPYLRDSLISGLRDAVAENVLNRMEKVKLFEIGAVWKGGEEPMMVGTAEESGPRVKEEPLPILKQTPKIYDNLPVSTTTRYRLFSRFPYIVRDVAVWVPGGTEPEKVLKMIRTQAGELCVRGGLFDTFEKQGKTSLAFRLIFQSFDRTLEDSEANSITEKIYAALRNEGFEIR